MDEASAYRAPIVEALQAYAAGRKASFHVPGHKAGAAFAAETSAVAWLEAIGAYDATELPGLDDLHAPVGAIAEAQRLAADCFGADRTYFLVGGSTAGNLAAIQAAVGPGELIVMQRDAHKSAIHALMLRGAGASFVPPDIDESTGLARGPSAAGVARALDEHPEAKAVFVTSPNYYGYAVDIAAIAEAAHARGKPLIVDEAHGAHFGMHPAFPNSALRQGADVVIQSTHKMLQALTMGAMLHVRGDRLPAERIEALLRMLQSSSPSYPILASLDWARRELHVRGAEAFEGALRAIEELHEALRPQHRRFASLRTDDPMKPLLSDRAGALSGYALLDRLAELGIYTEMATERHVVLACSAATRAEDMSALLAALDEIDLRNPAKKKENATFSSNRYTWGPISSSIPVFFDAGGKNSPSAAADVVEVRLEDAVGMASAEMVVPYPPGIPLLYPGETITREAAETLLRLREQGAAVQGPKDHTLRMLRVRRNPFDS
ncbi:aminotransferase class I/II-fold pyridoxal phosphate-dependent enzyme [Paenibacillus sp.]|uniref:aminotransferase class I/II-fold pyridoxal phosphate-dependent enzyme n=1 Tax=Paenibacillus sp. TaxID=58172 RepID=UPI002D5488EC|nr:aminotransferase class I/II-fold pyridoxal phosphate-dependent enzyme [Paenibacillus sp.]HZG87531.1 aminotransferase class I/II-fold pyridoxal phosphate-dependent enzyme [Paenibacillus sp.]